MKTSVQEIIKAIHEEQSVPLAAGRLGILRGSIYPRLRKAGYKIVRRIKVVKI